MRGARIILSIMPAVRRIIPADAGSTFDCQPEFLGAWDHPRGCGEHKSAHEALKPDTGSSPRMRGALFKYSER